MKTQTIPSPELKEKTILELISRVCDLNRDSVQDELDNSSEVRKILKSNISNQRKTQFLFRPLMEVLSFQGIGDSVVLSYMEKHGSITFFDILKGIYQQRKKHGSLCEKLEIFQSFKSCGYQKTKPSCNNQDFLIRCPLPRQDMLKGVLNIKSFSLYFFVRDQCQGDLISHFDGIIQRHLKFDGSGVTEAREALIEDFTQVFGIGDKLANMTLSYLLCADPENQPWVRVGQAMVAVDSLVHNFLHRTGILKYYQADHRYGPLCSKHCLGVLDIIISKIDASLFNPDYPKYFPRFVQFSIWRFCTLEALSICNGVNIDDSQTCDREDICPVFKLCDHVPLKPIDGGPDETPDSRAA
jgi:hypothetical protein